MIRFFDFFASLFGLILLSPIFLIISFFLLLDAGMPIFFKQERVGQGGRIFKLFKFRSMRSDTKNKSLLTIGENDNRITRIGAVLRKYKLDELPQLANVFLGDMSIVGPRPEVQKYVDLYNDQQKKVLSVRPGITDLASLEYIDENERLGQSKNPEETYIQEIMPHKLDINLKYLENRTVFSDVGVIFKTLLRIVS